jgi:N-acetylglutamate synthase-like GNAT family acetyltransferase
MQIQDITIRTDLQSGDLGYITYLHGTLYQQEYGYGLSFESYVAQGLHEFYQQYNSTKDCFWICEHHNRIVASLLLLHRNSNAAQLRFFLIHPAYRGMGLGKRLMELYMDFLHSHQYQSAYLWTTHEQKEAARLYTRYGFQLTEEKESTAFGKQLTEQRYDLLVV